MKEIAMNEINPHLFTIATLTGHAALAYGPYTAVMDNGPAAHEDFATKLLKTGDLYGDVFEVSRIRKEDFDFIKDKSGKYADVIQATRKSSSVTKRGHHYPCAFLQKVSGLTNHQLSSERPLKYTHMDVAGSSGFGDLSEPTTGSTVVALSMHLL